MTDEQFRALAEQHEKRRAAEAERRRAEQPPKPAAAPAAVLQSLRGVPVMTEAECAALRERQERHRRAEQESMRALALTPEAEARWLASCGVGARHRQIDARAELVPAELRWWAERVKPGGSAILCGPTGSGKSAAAIWAMRTLYRAGRADPGEWRCASAAFAGASELFALVFAKQPLTRFERVDLLVIDDWGMAYETDWPMAVLDRLIDVRWSELRSTIITTNLFPAPAADPVTGLAIEAKDTLPARYPRIYSRLCDSSGPGLVLLNRGDLRRAQR